METKTKDGVLVEQTQIEIVAIILSSCSEERLADLEQTEFFMTLATRFIEAITEDEMKKFISHNFAIKLLNMIAD